MEYDYYLLKNISTVLDFNCFGIFNKANPLQLIFKDSYMIIVH